MADAHGDAIEIAVVGHTNAGKTSLLRTLTRRVDFGRVSDRPGTTRHVEAIDLVVDGRAVLRLLDTPGLEDSTALMARLRAQDGTLPPPERVRAFLLTPEAGGRFEQEAKVLRALLGAEAAFHVIDTRDPVLPKHRAELEALSWCARPVLPVLNFVRDAASREADWQAALSEYGLHAIVRFDAVAPLNDSEQRLYRDLATLLRPREALLSDIAESLAFERLERRRASLAEIAALLVVAAATRRTLPREQVAPEKPASGPATPEVQAFRAAVLARTRACIAALLEIHAFAPDDARLDAMPWLDGRWESDVFNPEALGRAGQALGTGALIGASVGLAADVALAGLSLGAAATLGAAVGGAASQGFSGVGHAVANLVRRRVDLTVEDEVLALLADQMLGLLLTLEGRGHAASQVVALQPDIDPTRQAALRGLLAALAPARAHADWGIGEPAGNGARLAQVIGKVTAALRPLLPAPPP